MNAGNVFISEITTKFEQLPFVYQVEVLAHVHWYGKNMAIKEQADLEDHYRYNSKDLMNDIYKKQLAKPYNFTQLKQEIARLKYQELAPQVRNESTRLIQLITEAKNKAGKGGFAPIVDLLLETQKQIMQATEASQRDKLNGNMEAYQNILETSLTKEELQTLLTKQSELHQLEQYLRINDQAAQIRQSSPPKPL
ncbi:7572_t:CDS:2 [Ambispora leptoticha]|uniref:7572_t:CDS:1 n=1 Tax=Ambispora leptoticha TaxID=144679 RepID=A0A9N9AYK7_9GLOM|nr:7572_t:CDS:2 [Ambispora leptoticha]